MKASNHHYVSLKLATFPLSGVTATAMPLEKNEFMGLFGSTIERKLRVMSESERVRREGERERGRNREREKERNKVRKRTEV